MRDISQGLILRCVLPKRNQTKYCEVARNLLQSQKKNTQVRTFRFLFEDRPYELGRLLHAFGKFGVKQSN
jgi:hypothetical protein